MKRNTFGLSALIVLLISFSSAMAAEPLKALLVDGQNNHKWAITTPLIVKTLEGTGRFTVDVVTSPEKGGDMASFSPKFEGYDVVVSNYNGEPWNEATQAAFEEYVAGGGGLVSVHAADNSFPKWSAYNRMIGVGGWGGRTEKDGPYVRWKEDVQKITRDLSPGKGGAHGKRVPFLMIVRDPDHPITAGMPKSYMQVADELYGKLRGPAENMHVLATAFADPATGGSGEHEPILMTIQFGKGRVFHTTLGHDETAMKGVAFQTTLQRGADWAATGSVSLGDVHPQTLTADSAASRDFDSIAMPDVDGDGWVSIFNGKDLSGWTQKNGTATYRVEDGIVIGKTNEGSPNSFMCSDKEYGDFELTFEVKDDTGLNSGVQIRSVSKSDYKDGRVHGPQVEIETNPGESGYVYSEGTGRGWITKTQPIKDSYKNDSWNRFVVRAQGDRIQTWVNGRAITDLTDTESSKRGFFGLQVHGIKSGSGPFEVRWRDIRVREL